MTTTTSTLTSSTSTSTITTVLHPGDILILENLIKTGFYIGAAVLLYNLLFD